MAGAAHDHAAAIIVGADLLALAVRRHDIGLGTGGTVQHVDFLDHAVVVALAPCAEEISGTRPAAVDLLARYEVLDVAEGVGSVGEIGCRLVFLHGLRHVALADVDAARHHAAIARRAAKAGLVGIEHDAVDALAVKLERGVEARIARADDGHADALRKGNLWQRRGVVGLPPEGAGLEVGGEQRCTHDGNQIARSAGLKQARREQVCHNHAEWEPCQARCGGPSIR